VEKVKLSIRPEEFYIDESNHGIKGIIKNNVFLGADVHYLVELEDGFTVEVIQEATLEKPFEVGKEVNLGIQKEKINIFDFDSELNVMKGDFYENKAKAKV